MEDNKQKALSYAALGMMLAKAANPNIPERRMLTQYVDAESNKVTIKHTRKTRKGIKVTETPLMHDPYISRNRQKVYA